MQYLKSDCSPKLILFFQAKVSIAGNSNILNTLRTDINARSGINVRVGNFWGNNKRMVQNNHTGRKIMGEMNEKIAIFCIYLVS